MGLETAAITEIAVYTRGKPMLTKIRTAREEEGGFTLIELLIVIVILGVLAGIVVFAVGGITDRGNASACKADAKNVEIASEAYFAKNASYATAIDDATHTATTLVGATLLREAPSTTNGYTVTYTAATGKVTAAGACTVS
jgi:prepilin-type N-terminal cleavage/methylation domain-containing protein